MGDGNDGAAAQVQIAGEPQAQGDEAAAQAQVTGGAGGIGVDDADKARARNVKAAKALLADYEGDVEKLKASEPWLFSASSAPAPTGATGLPNAGAASDEGQTLRRWRSIAGLPESEE